jgi:hypothetical protein
MGLTVRVFYCSAQLHRLLDAYCDDDAPPAQVDVSELLSRFCPQAADPDSSG